MSLWNRLFGPEPAPVECPGCKHAALSLQLAHERERDFLATIEKVSAMNTALANERLSRAFVTPTKDEDAPKKEKRTFSVAQLAMPQSAPGHISRSSVAEARSRSLTTTPPAAQRT